MSNVCFVTKPALALFQFYGLDTKFSESVVVATLVEFAESQPSFFQWKERFCFKVSLMLLRLLMLWSDLRVLMVNGWDV